MSEALIFSFGSILFIITTAATFSFGMRRFRAIQVEDMADSGGYPATRSDSLTELHVTDAELESRPQSASESAG